MLLYLDDFNGAPRVVWGEELGMLEAEAIHVHDDGEASDLRLWLLYDVLQCQNVRAKNVLNAHIRSVAFVCNHTDMLLQCQQCMHVREFHFAIRVCLLNNSVVFCHVPVEPHKTQW